MPKEQLVVNVGEINILTKLSFVCKLMYILKIVERTCGEISREKVSFFQSPNYPVLINDSLDCTYQVYPDEDTCALRWGLNTLELCTI